MFSSKLGRISYKQKVPNFVEDFLFGGIRACLLENIQIAHSDVQFAIDSAHSDVQFVDF